MTIEVLDANWTSMDNGEFVGFVKKSKSKAELLKDKMFLEVLGVYLDLMCICDITDTQTKK